MKKFFDEDVKLRLFITFLICVSLGVVYLMSSPIYFSANVYIDDQLVYSGGCVSIKSNPTSVTIYKAPFCFKQMEVYVSDNIEVQTIEGED